MTPLRAAIYVRVSSDRQVENYSLETQEERSRLKASSLDYLIPSEALFREEGVSAKTLERPALKRMLDYVLDKKNNIGAVIAYDISRFSRNTSDFLAIQALLARHHIRIVLCSHETDESAESKLINTMIASIAEYDNTKKAERSSEGMRKRFESGYPNHKPPIGYLLINKKAVKDPETFDTLRKAWYDIAQFGWSLQKVADELNKTGIKAGNSRRWKGFTRNLCSEIFSNKFYIGVLTSKTFGEAKGVHEPMIDERTFYQVREIITGRRPRKHENYVKLNPDFPLRRIAVCVHCGNPMSAAYTTGRNKKRKIGYYMCPTRNLHMPNPSYPMQLFHDRFMDTLGIVEFDTGAVRWITEMVKESYESKFQAFVKSEKQAERELEETQELLKELNLKYLKNEFSKEEYQEMKKHLDVQLVTRQGVMNERKMAKLDIDIILNWIEFYLTNIPRLWTDAEPETRYRIGCSLFPEGIVFDGEKFRTPVLGVAYRLAEEVIAKKGGLGAPRVEVFEHILDAFVQLYNELRFYVVAPTTASVH